MLAVDTRSAVSTEDNNIDTLELVFTVSTNDEEKDKDVCLNARDLSIVWGSDHRYWKWTHNMKEDICYDNVEVAELLNVCSLQIDGKYEAQKLKEGLMYEVQFVVMLKDNLNISSPVNLTLALPDGTKQESKQYLMEEPRNRMIGITAGQFQAPNMCGDINFSLMETSGSIGKKGLVVIGALIVPKLF